LRELAKEKWELLQDKVSIEIPEQVPVASKRSLEEIVA